MYMRIFESSITQKLPFWAALSCIRQVYNNKEIIGKAHRARGRSAA